MKQVEVFRRYTRVVALGLEGHDRSGRPRSIDEVQGGAEQARERIR